MRARAKTLAEALGGELRGDDVGVEGAAIDSRALQPRQLFVAITGDRDGHDFAQDAVALGAAACLVSRPITDAPEIVVPDTRAALLDVGRFARSRLPDAVVGITGSVGKTTVKDFTASVLSTSVRVASSPGSFNNELGVPLTLFNAPDDTEAVVVEMGARGRGHIALLCDVAHPTVGVVTAVAHAHTELFGTIDDVAAAKAELIEHLPVDGTAVLNGDDERVAAMGARASAQKLVYSARGRSVADVVASSIALDDSLRPRFKLRSPWGDADVELSMKGWHQVGNALAAATAALSMGLSVANVASGLFRAGPSPWRMQLERNPAGALILNDAYNANPTSMAAALESLAALKATRRIAVLGTMAELGAIGAAEHERIATLADGLGIEVLVVGEPAYGKPMVATVDEAADKLGALGDGDAVLVKGSRVAGLERLAALLLGRD